MNHQAALGNSEGKFFTFNCDKLVLQDNVTIEVKRMVRTTKDLLISIAPRCDSINSGTLI